MSNAVMWPHVQAKIIHQHVNASLMMITMLRHSLCISAMIHGIDAPPMQQLIDAATSTRYLARGITDTANGTKYVASNVHTTRWFILDVRSLAQQLITIINGSCTHSTITSSLHHIMSMVWHVPSCVHQWHNVQWVEFHCKGVVQGYMQLMQCVVPADAADD